MTTAPHITLAPVAASVAVAIGKGLDDRSFYVYDWLHEDGSTGRINPADVRWTGNRVHLTLDNGQRFTLTVTEQPPAVRWVRGSYRTALHATRGGRTTLCGTLLGYGNLLDEGLAIAGRRCRSCERINARTEAEINV